MATVSGAEPVVLDMEQLKLEIKPWLDLNPYPGEANRFYTTALLPLMETWNMQESLTAWFPILSSTYSGTAVVSGTDQIQELMDTMNNWKAGYTLHDAHDIAVGIATTVDGAVVPL